MGVLRRRGIVAPADRTRAGHRLYAPDTVARLAQVRTLRELGLGLADSPTVEQVRAWVEPAELSPDPDVRAAVRRLGEDCAAGLPDEAPAPPRPDVIAVVRDLVGPAVARGIPGGTPTLASPPHGRAAGGAFPGVMSAGGRPCWRCASCRPRLPAGRRR
ncbi:helix-turn-helix domain-containing protein [Streptomyces globosus]|uniref:helix-turn-helix domain-containing protein n=1 Tax=Streptomyces globosus TaxID=68209 RepID=UPI0037F50A83